MNAFMHSLYVHMPSCMHATTHACTNVCMNARTHACLHSRTHVCLDPRTHVCLYNVCIPISFNYCNISTRRRDAMLIVTPVTCMLSLVYAERTLFTKFVENRLLRRGVRQRRSVLPWRQVVVGRVAIEHSHQALCAVLELFWSPDSDVELSGIHTDRQRELCHKYLR